MYTVVRKTIPAKRPVRLDRSDAIFQIWRRKLAMLESVVQLNPASKHLDFFGEIKPFQVGK